MAQARLVIWGVLGVGSLAVTVAGVAAGAWRVWKLRRRRNRVLSTVDLQSEIDFKELGIGGLDKELTEIRRRALASRMLTPEEVEELEVEHVRGILLYGPPGTGKTLIARKIGQLLRASTVKIVNGPEILDKYVGVPEKRIRDLFVDAENEQSRGARSGLHVLIFDEIDAICKKRGNEDNHVNDTIVDQLLAKMDGIQQLNNILVIGITNLPQVLDPALLRPGRFEIQKEINLPNEAGRLQILEIRTAKLSANKKLDESVNLKKLAKKTKGYSGADIAGLVREAHSLAIARQRDGKITMNDFKRALGEEVRREKSEEEDSSQPKSVEVKPETGVKKKEKQTEKKDSEKKSNNPLRRAKNFVVKKVAKKVTS